MDKQVSYWIDESLETIDVARILLEKGKYLEGAFFCHLACEKMLKATFVHRTAQVPPKIHSLNRLAEHSTIDQNMSHKQLRFLRQLNVFQIESRYPPNRHKLYKSTSANEFTRLYQETEEMIVWLQRQIQSSGK